MVGGALVRGDHALGVVLTRRWPLLPGCWSPSSGAIGMHKTERWRNGAARGGRSAGDGGSRATEEAAPPSPSRDARLGWRRRPIQAAPPRCC
eukprot:scaffold201_cov405-Prasinococcus_capsulatus_cf.AAC.16